MAVPTAAGAVRVGGPAAHVRLRDRCRVGAQSGNWAVRKGFVSAWVKMYGYGQAAEAEAEVDQGPCLEGYAGAKWRC